MAIAFCLGMFFGALLGLIAEAFLAVAGKACEPPATADDTTPLVGSIVYGEDDLDEYVAFFRRPACVRGQEAKTNPN
jgi:hypothetical protein